MQPTDWIIAVSSIASLVVAAFATAIAWNVHRGEAKRTQQAALTDQQHQANLVTAWETAHHVPKDQIDEIPEGALSEDQISDYGSYVYATRIVMTLVNRSSQPVYDLEINPDGFSTVFMWSILPPGEQEIGVPRYSVVDFTKGAFDGNGLLLNLSFRDAAGTRWVRQAMGTLVKVTSDKERDAAMGEGYRISQEVQRELQQKNTLRAGESKGTEKD